MSNFENTFGMDSTEPLRYVDFGNGIVRPLDANGHVIDLIDEENEEIVSETVSSQVTTPSSSLEFELNIKGSGSSLQDMLSFLSMKNSGLQNMAPQPMQTAYVEQTYEQPHEQEYYPAQPTGDYLTAEDMQVIQQKLQEQQSQQPLSFDKTPEEYPTDNWSQQAAPTSFIESINEEITEVPSKKAGFKKYSLGAFAIVGAIIAGPVIQSASSSASAVENCGPDIACLAGHFTGDLKPGNILHFIPENK